MKHFWRVAVLAAAMGCVGGGASAAGWEAVCDITVSGNCIKPNADGSISSRTTGASVSVAGAQYGLTIASSTALTVPATATWAIVQVDSTSTTAVRWKDDGGTPTSASGLEIPIGGSQILYGAAELAAVLYIQEGATAKLNVSYYK